MSSTVTQSLTLQPGGHSGWHGHEGPVLVVVKSGTVTSYDFHDPNCTPHAYTAGEAFVDTGDGHIARNEGTVPAEVTFAFLLPRGAGLRTELPNHLPVRRLDQRFESSGARCRTTGRRRYASSRRRRSESRTTFTQSSTTPASAPSASIAIGVRTAISPSVYFVTQAPTSQMARTTTTITIVSRLSTPGEYP
jgi:hypothetical protein